MKRRWIDFLNRPVFTLLAIVSPALLRAQSSPYTATMIAAGTRLFAAKCAGCHGGEGQGSEHGPKLAGSPKVRRMSREAIMDFMQRGVPVRGMPAFDLPPFDLRCLADFVGSLNPREHEEQLPGSPEDGMAIFFGEGKCATCHMVKGGGRAIGPDLTGIGARMSARELKQKLADPGRSIVTGYQLVNVALRDGRSLRGFLRGRSNFDLQLQDLDGRVHMVRSEQTVSVRDEAQSAMPPLKARPDVVQNLIAYLKSLTEPTTNGKNLTALTKAETTDIGFARIAHPQPGDWLTYNGNLSGNRYSGLKQIHIGNVSTLVVKWIFPIPHFGLEVTPLVADGVMYVAGPNQVFALDASTGRRIWHYQRPPTRGLVGDASLGSNRGVALLGGNVFMSTDNAHLIALNRLTGSLVWETVMPEDTSLPYGSTVAPLAVKDTIIAGVSGGDWGLRGFLACYRAATGELLWRRWTTPLKGEKGYETWPGKDPRFGGGATWLTGSYDLESDTLFWSTGNSFPEGDQTGRNGDYLYTDCMLALEPATGELKWWFQFNPQDNRGWDANQPSVLVNTSFHGAERKLLLEADRNGFLYILDRTTGKLLQVSQYIREQNWAKLVRPDQRPQPLPETEWSPDGMTCPALGTNWGSTAFSPLTRLYFLMAYEKCEVMLKQPPGVKRAEKRAGDGTKWVRAIDIETGKIVWETKQTGISDNWSVDSKAFPGMLATAGGILFHGDPNGAFVAVDERDGRPLWHLATNVTMKASPMTYMVEGRQFVAVAAGTNIIAFGLP